MWALWKARNKFFFEGSSASPADTLSPAITLAREWNFNSALEIPATKKGGHHTLSTSSSSLTVRTDAAWSSSNNVAGLGWVVLSSSQPQEFQERRQFVASPLMAEGLAMREAVLTCRSLNLKEVRFESDSSQLIKCLNGKVVIGAFEFGC